MDIVPFTIWIWKIYRSLYWGNWYYVSTETAYILKRAAKRSSQSFRLQLEFWTSMFP